MAQSMTFSVTVSGDVSGSVDTLISGEAKQVAGPSITHAWGGSLTTRTNNTSGTITMDDSDHEITTGMRVDLYWDGGHRYGVTVGTVSGTAVPITTSGGGDNLPSPAPADITVAPAISVDLPFNYADLKALAAAAGIAKSLFVMSDGVYNINPIYLDPTDSTDPTSLYYWHNELGTDNPVDGYTPTKVYISHADEDRTITDSKIEIITGD